MASVACFATIVLAVLACAPAAQSVGTPNGYPRTFAIMGTGEGVRLNRFEVQTSAIGRKVRVRVRLGGASLAGPRRIAITVGRCKGSASSPTCKTAARHSINVTEQTFSLTKTFTIARPPSRPGALRVRARSTGAMPVPPCTATQASDSLCQDPRFQLTGDILLNAETWKFKRGTWWGITTSPKDGLQLDRVAFNSGVYGWVATSPVAATVITTIGNPGAPPARTYKNQLLALKQKEINRTPRFGTAFESRPSISVLDYSASINDQRFFTVNVPLPPWSVSSGFD